MPSGQTHFFRCCRLLPLPFLLLPLLLPLLFVWGVADSCLPRAFGVGEEGESVLGSGVVGHGYGWCRFPVMMFAPESDALQLVRDGDGDAGGRFA